jgi:hypothetical protein
MTIKSLLPRPRNTAERQLRRELAAYDSPSDIADLVALMDTQEGPEVDMIRNILSGKLQETSRRHSTSIP